jgi:hypothetical protein
LKHLALSYFQTPNENENTFSGARFLLTNWQHPPMLNYFKGFTTFYFEWQKEGWKKGTG